MRLIIVSIVLLAAASGFASAAQSPSPSSNIDNSQPGKSAGTAVTTISGTGLSTAGIIGGAVGGFVQGGGQNAGLDIKRFALSSSTGAAAAPGAKQWNVWGAYSRSNIAYTFAPLQNSGNVNVYLAGVDYTFDNNVVFGVAVAVDRTDVDLTFSAGKLKGSGVTVSPYLGIVINKNIAIDGTLGIGRTDIDTVTAVAGTVTGSTRSDRTVGTLGLTYREVFGAWSLTGRGAFLALRDKINAQTLSNTFFIPESTIDVSQFRLVGQVAYTSGSVTPYFSLSYINDLRRPDQAPVGGVAAANDRDAWTPAIGIRFRADNSVYGSIQYSTERARSEIRNNQFLLNLGIRF